MNTKIETYQKRRLVSLMIEVPEDATLVSNDNQGNTFTSSIERLSSSTQ